MSTHFMINPPPSVAPCRGCGCGSSRWGLRRLGARPCATNRAKLFPMSGGVTFAAIASKQSAGAMPNISGSVLYFVPGLELSLKNMCVYLL